MRGTKTIPALIRLWLRGILLTLFMVVVTTPAVAILSDKTGQIQGQAPTVAGHLQVLFPDGATVVANNAMVGMNQIPNQFRVSSTTTGLVLEDTDGDSSLSALVDTEHATLSWKLDGTEVGTNWLEARFGNSALVGKTLTLEVSAPVTASSVTGLPTTATPQILTSTYSLIVPLPISSNSTLELSPVSIVADGVSTSLVSFTARDVNNNPVLGMAVRFNTTGAPHSWGGPVKDNGDGTYTRELVAGTVAGTVNVVADVTIEDAGWNMLTPSKIVTLMPGPLDERNSTLEISPASIVADGVSTSLVSFTARDVNNNPVSGMAVSFDTTGAPHSWGGPVKDNGDGTYTRELVAGMVAGTVNVEPKVGDVTVEGISKIVTMTPGFTAVSVNDHTFGITEGFPTTGFTGATFALSVPGVPSDYTWNNGGSSWVTVDDSGNVAFTDKGNSTPVTITATSKGGGAPLAYTFSVNTWFINNGSTYMPWSDASNWCAAQGLTLPTRGDMTMGANVRGMGSLLSEWGSTGNYSSSGFTNNFYWTSEQSQNGFHYIVSMFNPNNFAVDDDTRSKPVVCR